MNDLGCILNHKRSDVHLEAYLLKRMCRQSPETVLANAEQFAQVFDRFDPQTAGDILDELVGRDQPETTRFLLNLLAHDLRWTVQVKVIKHLARRPEEPRVLAALLRLLSADSHQRAKACVLASLSRIRLDIPLKVVKPYLTHADSRVRASALEALLARDLTGLTEVLSILLNDQSPRVKALAAVGLWRLGNPILLELIKDAEQLDHKVAYLYALGLTGRDSETRRILVRALSSPHEAERLMACRSLRAVAEGDDIPALLEVVTQIGGRETRRGLVRSCVEIDRMRTVDTMHSMLRDAERGRQPRRVATVVSLFTALHEPTGHASVRPTREAPTDRPADVDSWPVALTGETDVEYLSGFLDSPDGRVRANAIEAVTTFSNLPPVEAALVRCYRSEVPRVRANATLPLWRSGFQSVMSGLKEMVGSSHATIRASAAWALGRIGGIIATGYLEKLLDDPDEATRRLALEGLNV